MNQKQQQDDNLQRPTITAPFVSWYTEGVHIIDPSRKASLEVAKFIDDSKDPDGRTWLMNLYTAAEYRNRGMATRLIEAAKNYCRERNIKALYLWCELEMIPFYNKRGFRGIHQLIQEYGRTVHVLVCPISGEAEGGANG